MCTCYILFLSGVYFRHLFLPDGDDICNNTLTSLRLGSNSA